MRTDHSQRVLKNLLGALDKAEFREELHPRARTGKFAKKPGKGGVGAIGAVGAVGAVKVRAARLPVHLRRATPAEWKKEKQRIAEMTPAQLHTRMNKITQPQKMKNFAEALVEENYQAMASEAFRRLRAMGFEKDGSPAGRASSVETPRPAPRPPAVARWNLPAKPVMSQSEIAERKRILNEGLAAQRAAEQERRAAAMRAAEAARIKEEEEAKKPLVIGGRSAVGTTTSDLEKMASEPGYLVDAVAISKPGEQYSGLSFKVKSADGKKAVWKARGDTGLEKERFGDRDKGQNFIRHNLDARIPEFEREFAAYRFSEEMGMGVVPPVVKAKVPIGAGGEGHLMGWVDGKVAHEAGSYIKDAERGHIDLLRITALDFIVGNTDRHQNNFMRGEDGRYYAIDDGLVFPKDSDLNDSSFRCNIAGRIYGAKIPPQIKAEVERLTPEKITTIMQEGGFPQEDIDGVVARREVFLGRDKFDIENRWFTAATSIASTLKRERMAEAAVRRYE